MAKTIIGVFPNRAFARRAIDVMLNYGYESHDISMISAEDGQFLFENPATNIASDSRVSHTIMGIFIGAVLGLLVGLIAPLIPGIRMDTLHHLLGLSSNTSLTLLTTAIGAAAGGIIGLLTGARSEEINRSEYYSREENQVMVAFAVPSNDEGEVKRLLRDNGVRSIKTIDTDRYEEPAVDYGGYRLAGVKGGRKTSKRKPDVRDYLRD